VGQIELVVPVVAATTAAAAWVECVVWAVEDGAQG